jgi:hypothetical protein
MHHPTGTAHRVPALLLPQEILEAEPPPQMARVVALPASSAILANAAPNMDGAERRQITAEPDLLLPQTQVLPARTACVEEPLGLDAPPVNAVASMAIAEPALIIVVEGIFMDKVICNYLGYCSLRSLGCSVMINILILLDEKRSPPFIYRFVLYTRQLMI